MAYATRNQRRRKTMGHFADQARQALAEDILNEAEVIAEIEDNVTISIPKELWDEFCGREQTNA